MQIANSVIAITGAGRGLGRAMAMDLAKRGARLALIDVDRAALEQSVAACAEVGDRAALSYVIDVTSETEVDAGFARILSDFGQLDALVNNAGIMRDGMLLKVREGKLVERMSLAQWQSVIDVNLTGVFLCTRAAAAAMVEGSGGVIINLSSLSRAGNMGQTNYSATKAGVASMTVTWARELARFGVRVAAIAPGYIATDMVAQMRPQILEGLLKQVPSRRLGEPGEIAGTVAFILENDYLSGRVIEIDGGARI